MEVTFTCDVPLNYCVHICCQRNNQRLNKVSHFFNVCTGVEGLLISP